MCGRLPRFESEAAPSTRTPSARALHFRLSTERATWRSIFSAPSSSAISCTLRTVWRFSAAIRFDFLSGRNHPGRDHLFRGLIRNARAGPAPPMDPVGKADIDPARRTSVVTIPFVEWPGSVVHNLDGYAQSPCASSSLSCHCRHDRKLKTLLAVYTATPAVARAGAAVHAFEVRVLGRLSPRWETGNTWIACPDRPTTSSTPTDSGS